MNKKLIREVVLLTITSFLGYSLVAQTPPVEPERGGVQPASATFYVNSPDVTEFYNMEAKGPTVALTSEGNAVIGWRDDGQGIRNFGAVWTIYSRSTIAISPRQIVSNNPQYAGQSIECPFLGFFRTDGSPVPAYVARDPRVRANLFGSGFGMGATIYNIDNEIPELLPIQQDNGGNGGFPAVQLLDNRGNPLGIVLGASDEDAQPAGDIVLADWAYLSNGDIVIVSESRQNNDLVTRFGGSSGGPHVVFRIVKPDGTVVKPYSLVSDTPVASEMRSGVAVTKNGFAVRFVEGGRAKLRIFDNQGNPITGNIDLASVTGQTAAGEGGLGDASSLQSNGQDAYVSVNIATVGGKKHIWVTVINENGSIRYSKSAIDDMTLTNPLSVDAAIDEAGRVIVVFEDTGAFWTSPIILARILGPNGNPLAPTFYVSEMEPPSPLLLGAYTPKVAWREGLIAIVWQSLNAPGFEGIKTIASRCLSTFKAGSAESVGLTRIVPDTPIIVPPANALGNWEPYISVLGNSVFLIEGNTFAEGMLDAQRFVVMLQPVDGGPGRLVEGFYADDGTPYKGKINASRQNGNPGRVAGDRRPGATRYMVGAEASPHAFPAFQSDNRWKLGFDRLSDGRYATVQIYELDISTLTPKPLTKALDAINGRLTSGRAPGSQIGRFGGDIACLDNGNFVVVVDDRSDVRVQGAATVAVILAPDGSVVKESWLVDPRDIWSNVTSYKGGFCIRVHEKLYFYDNDGNLLGTCDQATSGLAFDTGRGDGTRIAGHINSPYVFLAGRVTTADRLVQLAVFDSRTQQFVASAVVSEPGFAGDYDRVNLAVDALNRVTVAWVVKPAGYQYEQVAARVFAFDPDKKELRALTPSFFAFINNHPTSGIRSLQMSVAMTTKQICIAAKGEINLQNKPELGPDSPQEINFYTVLSHPAPADDPTPPIGGPITLSITKTPAGKGKVIWSGGGVLQTATNILGPWTDIQTSAQEYEFDMSEPRRFFRVRR